MTVPRWLRLTAGATLVCLTVVGCSRSAETYLERGDAQLKAGNVDAAVLEYRNAVGRDLMSGRARLKLADAYLRRGSEREGLDEYVRAADLLPSDVGVQVKAGSLLLLAGRADDAKARAEKALAIDAKHIDAMVLRANAMAGLADLEGALEQMQRVLSLDSTAVRQSNLGAIQVARGNLPEAEAAFRSAVASDPASVNATLALGQFLWASGRRPEAEEVLEAAFNLDPAALETNRAMALFYLQSNQAPEAEPYLRKTAEVAKTAEATVMLAGYYARVGRPADALTVLEALSTQPRYWALARTRIAELQYGGGKSADAFKTLEEVVKREPGFAGARLVLGRLLLADGKVDEAMREAREAQNGDPGNYEVHYLLGAVYEAKRNWADAAAAYSEVLRLNPRATAAQVRLALVAMQRNDMSAATQFAEQAIAAQPDNLEAGLALARSLLARGEVDGAFAVTQRLAQASPSAPAVQKQVGFMALARGDRAAARVAFEKALALNDPTVESLQALVSLDLDEKKTDEARARIEKHLAKSPDNSAVLALAGRTWAAIGDLNRAEAFLRRSIEKDASNMEAYMELARVYTAQRKLDQAVEEFDRFAARQPDAVGPQTMAALIVHSQGKTADAQKRYERLVELNPRAAVASNNLAWIFASRGEQLDRALQLAQAAKAEIPDDAEVNDTLAFVYLQKRLPTLALPFVRLAVEKQPNNPAFHYHLGLAYAGVGDKPAARQALQQALRLGSDFSGAEDARQVLRTLG